MRLAGSWLREGNWKLGGGSGSVEWGGSGKGGGYLIVSVSPGGAVELKRKGVPQEKASKQLISPYVEKVRGD